jgi:hypothetical protein
LHVHVLNAMRCSLSQRIDHSPRDDAKAGDEVVTGRMTATDGP